MVDSIPTQQFFDMWKKGLEDSTQAWARLLSQSTAAPPDPTAFWRPAVEQWVQTWARMIAASPVSPDIATQWKQFLDQTIAELRPGDYAEIERHVEMDAIAEFIDAVGDFNPIHSDPAYAAATSFGEPIAPGVFTAGLISAVIGTQLPGPGAIYLSQSLKF